jgi:hypothetical protein
LQNFDIHQYYLKDDVITSKELEIVNLETWEFLKNAYSGYDLKRPIFINEGRQVVDYWLH